MKLKIGIAFFLFCAVATLTHAQYYSRDGYFYVDQVRGCAPLTINVTVPLAASLCDCEYFYEDRFFQDSVTYTYNTPGTYNLIVLFQNPPDPARPDQNTDRITITVLPDTPPTFEVYSCKGNAVQFNLTDANPNFTSYDVNFGDGTPIQKAAQTASMLFHTYLTPGTKTISVEGRSSLPPVGDAGNCTPATQQIVPINAFVAPTIDLLTVVNEQEIQLDFDLKNQDNVQFRLEMATENSTNFQNLQNVFQSNSITVSNLTTDDKYYCFRLATYDPCDAAIDNYSNVICSSNFDVTAINSANRLAWETSSAGVSNYSFTKNSDPPLSAGAAIETLDDPNVICAVNYCYQQTTNYANGTRSISLIKCDTAFSTNIPTVVENISTVVSSDNKSVDLKWTQDPAFNAASYTVFKSANGNVATQHSSPVTTYIDNEYINEAVTCYKISYQDACENKSPLSRDACPIKLLANLSPNNAINLSWTEYDGWKNGVNHYVIEKFNAGGQLLAAINAGSALAYADNTQDLSNQVLLYRITAISNQPGVSPSISNTLTIIKEPNLFYPTAFTPNSDGLNDIFNVFGQFIITFEMRIFNRWGEMMYFTDDLEKGWDGTFKGSLMPEGTYVFRATLTDQAGRTFDRSGTVVLLKKR